MRSGRIRLATAVNDRLRHIRATGAPLVALRERAPGRLAAASRRGSAPSCGSGGRHQRPVRGRTRRGDFLVSYTQSDREWVEWLAWLLEEARFRRGIWVRCSGVYG